MSWRVVPFETLYAEPSRNGVYKSREHHGTGVKIINMGELFAHNVIADQEMSRLAMSEAEMARFGLADGDLLFGRRSLVEAGAGKCSLVEGLSEPTTFESSIIRVRLDKNKARPRFYWYWFQSHQGKGVIRSIVTGTNVKGVTGTNLKHIRVVHPPVGAQDKVIALLRIYDDLVENNRRRIALLEQSARLLYKEWFVRLRFPGHEHVQMVDGLPARWEKRTLGSIAPLSYGKGLKEDDRIPGPYPVYGSSGVVGTHEKALVAGPGIIVGRKGNAGSVYWSASDFFPIDTVYFVEPSAVSYYLYYSLLNVQFISTDVAVPGLNRDYAHSRELCIPSDNLLRLFESTADPIHQQISTLEKQSETLAKARDLLLPRLMSGEIAV